MQEIRPFACPITDVRIPDTLTRRYTSNNRPFLVRNSWGLGWFGGLSVAKKLTPLDSRTGNRQITGKLKC